MRGRARRHWRDLRAAAPPNSASPSPAALCYHGPGPSPRATHCCRCTMDRQSSSASCSCSRAMDASPRRRSPNAASPFLAVSRPNELVLETDCTEFISQTEKIVSLFHIRTAQRSIKPSNPRVFLHPYPEALQLSIGGIAAVHRRGASNLIDSIAAIQVCISLS
jgi:hypothetical protein